MDTPDEHAATAARGLLRDRLSARPQTRRWAHHVADLNSGEIHTTVMDQPPASTSRIQRLSRLSSVRDTTIFGGPWYRLTTRTPYLAAPEAWVVARIDYFNPRVGMQWTPQEHPEDLKNLSCYFSQLPAERCLLSISLEAIAVTSTGHASVGWVPLDQGAPVLGVVRFPIQGPITDYTLDFTFEPGAIDPPEFVMTLEGGIDWMLFNSVTLRTPPLVALPGPF